MSKTKFASGAFVFTKTRGFVPRNPEDVVPLAVQHGFDASIVPPYAGDRAAVGRAIARTDTKVAGTQYLLRPIKRNGSEVVYGIVREDRTGDDHLDHDHEATVSWKAEPDPAVITGDHTIANRVRLAYAELRGKLVSDDWTATVTKELERLGSLPFREDGRVYWVPPQSLDAVRRLQSFLAEVGIVVVVAEVESENAGVVTEVVAESVADQLERLEREVQDFSETQRPSLFSRRLEEYQRLRERAILYQAALGIGAERTVQVLSELERKVSAMLDVRTGMVVHKDGSVSVKGASADDSRGDDLTPVPSPAGGEGRQEAPTTLTFAGASFVPAASDDPDVLVFTSGDDKAKTSVAMLESMGLAGKWQKAGSVEVSIRNSGRVGAETSIRVRGSRGIEMTTVGRSLAGMGIGVGV